MPGVLSSELITCLKKCQYLAICIQLVSLLRLVLNFPFFGIWLFAVYALHFISPGAIRDSWKGGRPTHSALVLEKGSQRYRKASIQAFSWRGMAKRGRGARSWGTVKGSQIRQGRSSRRRGSRVRKAQKEFGGKSAETWSDIQLGEENLIANSTIPSRQAISSLTRA